MFLIPSAIFMLRVKPPRPTDPVWGLWNRHYWFPTLVPTLPQPGGAFEPTQNQNTNTRFLGCFLKKQPDRQKLKRSYSQPTSQLSSQPNSQFPSQANSQLPSQQNRSCQHLHSSASRTHSTTRCQNQLRRSRKQKSKPSSRQPNSQLQEQMLQAPPQLLQQITQHHFLPAPESPCQQNSLADSTSTALASKKHSTTRCQHLHISCQQLTALTLQMHSQATPSSPTRQTWRHLKWKNKHLNCNNEFNLYEW